jgi:hypothetical protein
MLPPSWPVGKGASCMRARCNQAQSSASFACLEANDQGGVGLHRKKNFGFFRRRIKTDILEKKTEKKKFLRLPSLG